MVGTAEQSRLKVRNYFHELRETLNRQEIVALTTVDNHIREKLCMLRQQQEDMTILLSQISAVCHQCESTLQSVRITRVFPLAFWQFLSPNPCFGLLKIMRLGS